MMRAALKRVPQQQCNVYCIPRVTVYRGLTTLIAGSPSTPTGIDASATPAIQLRQYQEECIQSVLASLKKGQKRLGISLATGSGKTVIFTHLIDRVAPPKEEATRTLILVHRRELVEQAARHCINAYPSKRVEIEMGNSHASGTADITIASVMSITSGDRMNKFDPTQYKLVLVDEAHHIVASGYLKTLEHFGLLKPTKSSPALVGVSATFSRFDGLKLSTAIDHIVYHKDYIDMIGEKWLTDVIFTTVQSKANLAKVRRGAFGDFLQGDLSRAVNTDETNEITVRTWLTKAEKRKSTIVFCVDLSHVSGLTDMFRKHGIDARFVTGDTPKRIRSERLDEFRRGDFPVLINCGVYTEGTDIPNIDCVLLSRPTKSRNLLVQMIGRGMRLHPGKKNCHVIDMVASLETGIVTVPTLFGLDPDELVKEAGVKELSDLRERKRKETRPEQKTASLGSESIDLERVDSRVIFTDYDSVFDLIDDTSGERHIRAISQSAWVQVNEDRYILSSQEGSHVALEKVPSERDSFYHITYTPRVPSEAVPQGGWRPFQRTRVVGTATSFIDAVHAADTFVSETFPRYIVDKNQAWRKTAATAGQISFLNKLRPADKPLQSSHVTKGKAADMITKLKFGAKGRLEKMRAMNNKESRGREKVEQARQQSARERVRVGPLTDQL